MLTVVFGFAYIGFLTVPIVRGILIFTYGLPKLWSAYYQVASLAYFHTAYSEPPISSTLMFRDPFVVEKRLASIVCDLLPPQAVYFAVLEPLWPLEACGLDVLASLWSYPTLVVGPPAASGKPVMDGPWTVFAQRVYDANAGKQAGVPVITGPTGCGKSTAFPVAALSHYKSVFLAVPRKLLVLTYRPKATDAFRLRQGVTCPEAGLMVSKPGR